jgi:hypothetical protein
MVVGGAGLSPVVAWVVNISRGLTDRGTHQRPTRLALLFAAAARSRLAAALPLTTTK